MCCEGRRDERWSGDIKGRWERFADHAAGTDEYVVDLAELREWRVPDGHDVFAFERNTVVLISLNQFKRWDMDAGTVEPLAHHPLAVTDPFATVPFGVFGRSRCSAQPDRRRGLSPRRVLRRSRT